MESTIDTLTNKNHWYDGLFYDRVIAPNQDDAFAHVMALVAAGSTVLDVGCGTGRLAFQLAGKCSRIDGIDPSRKNIETAQRKLHLHPTETLQFHHTDVLRFLDNSTVTFDYATISYVIHEIDERQRTRVLQAIASAARTIILVDYLVPQPSGSRKAWNHAVEFAAGREHYRNFRSFVDGNGLAGLAERAELKIVREFRDDPPSSHILLLAPALV